MNALYAYPIQLNAALLEIVLQRDVDFQKQMRWLMLRQTLGKTQNHPNEETIKETEETKRVRTSHCAQR